MDGTATISLDTLDELREKAEEARLATNRSKKFTSKLEDHILETEHPGDSRAYRIKNTKIVMVKEKKTNGNDNSK